VERERGMERWKESNRREGEREREKVKISL
jgi:hypothetical protein